MGCLSLGAAVPPIYSGCECPALRVLQQIRGIGGRRQGKGGARRSAFLWGPRAKRGRTHCAGPLDAAFSAGGTRPPRTRRCKDLRGRDTLIWDRRRPIEPEPPSPPARDPFADLLENAPVMALLIGIDSRVVAANRAAREFFDIDPTRLPASLVEVTLESRLFEIVN